MPEEKVQKNGDAIIAGDFTFELEGNWIQKFFKGFFKKKYEEKPITDLTFEEAKLLYIRFLKETDSNVKINNWT